MSDFARAELRKLQCQCLRQLTILVELDTAGAVSKVITHQAPAEGCRWYAWRTRKKRTLKTWLGSFVFCTGCNRRHQVRTFTT